MSRGGEVACPKSLCGADRQSDPLLHGREAEGVAENVWGNFAPAVCRFAAIRRKKGNWTTPKAEAGGGIPPSVDLLAPILGPALFSAPALTSTYSPSAYRVGTWP